MSKNSAVSRSWRQWLQKDCWHVPWFPKAFKNRTDGSFVLVNSLSFANNSNLWKNNKKQEKVKQPSLPSSTLSYCRSVTFAFTLSGQRSIQYHISKSYIWRIQWKAKSKHRWIKGQIVSERIMDQEDKDVQNERMKEGKKRRTGHQGNGDGNV